jgi:hypothetical protein
MHTTRIMTRVALAAMMSLSISAAYAEGDHNAFDQSGPFARVQGGPFARVIVSSPSANDRGTNSNYPLDPKHTVIVSGGGIVMTTGGDTIVQSAASLPASRTPPASAFAAMPHLPGG